MTTQPPVELSAIILCFRAGDAVHEIAGELHRDLEASGVAFELVLVANYDAGGADPTPAAARAFADAHRSCCVITREKRGAMGWDMRSGLEASSGSYLIAIDGDNQNPVTDVLRMYREMKATGVPFMKGRRTTRLDGFRRRLVSFAYNGLFRIMFRTGSLWDINGKPKGLTREAYEVMNLTSDDWFVDAEMVLEAKRNGLGIGEMPVLFFQNEHRGSFVDSETALEFIRNMTRFRWRRRGR